MTNETETSTLPKPFIFVLMPFDRKFDDIYKFGIRGAANEVGAYAERLDEQIFVEGMLDRMFNQISKADVIVADMTGRNPNVFYEVGYAHALGKIVLLLTQAADDIPFDLKHRQHTVYGDSISTLKSELVTKLQWAIGESRRKLGSVVPERFSLRLFNTSIPRSGTTEAVPVVGGTVKSKDFGLPLQLRNDSFETASRIRYVYLFCEESANVVPCTYISSTQVGWLSTIRTPWPLESFEANEIDAPDKLSKQFRLSITFPELPPGAVETSALDMMFSEQPGIADYLYRIRFLTERQSHDFSFRLALQYEELPEKTPKDTARGESQ